MFEGSPLDAHTSSDGGMIELSDGEGETLERNSAMAGRVGVQTVRHWRGRFAQQRLDGLLDEPRPGRFRTISDEQIEQVIVKTLETVPSDVGRAGAPGRWRSVWFELTVRKLRRSAHRSVRELNPDIQDWTDKWNEDPRTYVWERLRLLARGGSR